MSTLIDWNRLLEPVCLAEPSGPNLEYSAEFAALERVALGTPDQRMGNAFIAGQPPDPDAVLTQASALLERTKDVRVAVHLLRAALVRGGVPEFVAGVGALRSLCERFWGTLHPGLDPEDDDPAAARANSLLGLARPELLRELRRADWIQLPGIGALSLEQVLALLRDPANSSAAPGVESARLGPAFRAAAATRSGEWIAALELAREHVQALTRVFTAHAAAAPDLEALWGCLHEPLPPLRAALPAANGIAVPDTAGLCDHPSGSAPLGGASSISIRDRAEVIRALDVICAYYREHEPSSPLPLLLRRCQRLASLDFLEILRELAPEALPKIDLINGTTQAHAK